MLHEYRDLITELKGKNAHFDAIFNKHNELDQQILSFGPDLEVVSPEWFREHIGNIIKENFEKYFPMQKGCTEE